MTTNTNKMKELIESRNLFRIFPLMYYAIKSYEIGINSLYCFFLLSGRYQNGGRRSKEKLRITIGQTGMDQSEAKELGKDKNI